MGMGAMANTADIISGEDLKKIVPAELAELEQALEDTGMSFDDFCRVAQYGDGDLNGELSVLNEYTDEQLERITKAFHSTEDAFQEKTGMSLYIVYRDEDSGDRYDDFDGGAWAVSGTTTKSPELVKAEETFGIKVSNVFWTVYG